MSDRAATTESPVPVFKSAQNVVLFLKIFTKAIDYLKLSANVSLKRSPTFTLKLPHSLKCRFITVVDSFIALPLCKVSVLCSYILDSECVRIINGCLK